MYRETTNDITVSVNSVYIEDDSVPTESRYVWAYQVRIENNGSETVRLRSRVWSITDANGHTQEIRGAGVVGKQPLLHPGDSFEYTSGTPLATPSGLMVGSYRMERSNGEYFDVRVPAFSLDSPHESVRLN